MSVRKNALLTVAHEETITLLFACKVQNSGHLQILSIHLYKKLIFFLHFSEKYGKIK